MKKLLETIESPTKEIADKVPDKVEIISETLVDIETEADKLFSCTFNGLQEYFATAQSYFC